MTMCIFKYFNLNIYVLEWVQLTLFSDKFNVIDSQDIETQLE